MSEEVKVSAKSSAKKSPAEVQMQPKKPRGAQKGNRNAAKLGEDLRWEMYLSKARRGFFDVRHLGIMYQG